MSPSSRRRISRGNPRVITALTVLILAALWYLNERNTPDGEADVEFTEQTSAAERGPATREEVAGGFTKLRGCTLSNHRNNDGDSFHLRHADQQFEMRLYYADCPEKRRHQYNGKRIAEQGRYFGGLNEKQTVAVGESARDFTTALLRKHSFTIYTKWEEVYDSERYYAFVEIDGADGSTGWLHELLVSRGLARIHTKGIPLPNGGLGYRSQKRRLVSLESQAKAAALGGWSRK